MTDNVVKAIATMVVGCHGVVQISIPPHVNGTLVPILRTALQILFLWESLSKVMVRKYASSQESTVATAAFPPLQSMVHNFVVTRDL